MHYTKLIKFYIFIMLFILPCSVSSSDFDLDEEIRQLGNDVHKAEYYEKSLKKCLQDSFALIDDQIQKSGNKKLGIFVGERHDLQGVAYYEILLLKFLHSRGVDNLLTELSQRQYDELMAQNNNSLIRQKIQAALQLKMNIICAGPDNTEVIERDITQNINSDRKIKDKKILESIFNEIRETSFIDHTLKLEKSFVFVTGFYHLSALYNNQNIKEGYNPVFLYAAPLDSPEKQGPMLERIKECKCIQYVIDRYQQHIDFQNDTNSFLHVSIMLNPDLSLDVLYTLSTQSKLNLLEI